MGEEDQLQLLQKMKNLRNKISKMEDKVEDPASTSGTTSPQPVGGRGGRGRGRGPRGRGKTGSGSDDDEWSMKKYDFDAPDIKEAVESHKPNFVKAPRRVFEKHDGYYSEEEIEGKEDENEEDVFDQENELKEGSEDKDDKSLSKTQIKSDENSDLKSLKGDSNDKMENNKDLPISSVKDDFKRVTRAEWNKMSYKDKKKYLKERRKRKRQQTVFIKDDSDNEQLSSDEGDEMEELEFSDSEDEKDKGERLAKEALKSYAKAFTKEDHPEDYKLVMRKDTVEAELADEGETNYE